MPQRDMPLNSTAIKEIENINSLDTINKPNLIFKNINNTMNNSATITTTATVAQPIIISSSPSGINISSDVNNNTKNYNIKNDNNNKGHLSPSFLSVYDNKTKNADPSSPIMIKQPPPPPSALNKFSFQPNFISPSSLSPNNNLCFSSDENVNSFFNPKSAQLSSSYHSDHSNYMKDIKSASSFVSPSSNYYLPQDHNVNLISASYQPSSMMHEAISVVDTTKLSSSLNYKSTNNALNSNSNSKGKPKVWFTKGIPISENTSIKSQRMHRKRTMRLTKQAQNDVKLYYNFDIDLLLQISLEQWVDFITVTTLTLWQYPSIELSTHFMTKAYNNIIHSSAQEISSFLFYRRFLHKFMIKTSPNPFVILHAIVYLYKLKECSPNEIVTPGSELFIFPVLIMMADKFIQDVHQLPAKYWAMATKITVEDFILFQRKLIKYLGYSLFVSYSEIENVVCLIEQFLNEDMDFDYLNNNNNNNKDINSSSISQSYPSPPETQQNSLDGNEKFHDDDDIKDEMTVTQETSQDPEKLLSTFKKELKKQNEYIPKVFTFKSVTNERRIKEDYNYYGDDDSMDGDDERDDDLFELDQGITSEYHNSSVTMDNGVGMDIDSNVTENFNIVNSFSQEPSSHVPPSYSKMENNEMLFSATNPFATMNRMNHNKSSNLLQSTNDDHTTFIPVVNDHSNHQFYHHNIFDNHSYDPYSNYSGGMTSFPKHSYSLNNNNNNNHFSSKIKYDASIPLSRKHSQNLDSYYNGKSSNHGNNNDDNSNNSNGSNKKVSMLSRAMSLLRRNNDKNKNSNKSSKTLPRNFKSSKYNVLSKDSTSYSDVNDSENSISINRINSQKMNTNLNENNNNNRDNYENNYNNNNNNNKIYHYYYPSNGSPLSINSNNKRFSLPAYFNNLNYNDLQTFYSKEKKNAQDNTKDNKNMDGSETLESSLFKENYDRDSSTPLLSSDERNATGKKPRRKSRRHSISSSDSSPMNSEDLCENFNKSIVYEDVVSQDNHHDNNNDKENTFILEDTNHEHSNITANHPHNVHNIYNNDNSTSDDAIMAQEDRQSKVNDPESSKKFNEGENSPEKKKEEIQFIDYNNTVNLLKAIQFGDDSLVKSFENNVINENNEDEMIKDEMDDDIFNESTMSKPKLNSKSSKTSFLFPRRRNTSKSGKSSIPEESTSTTTGRFLFGSLERNKSQKRSNSISKKFYTLGHSRSVNTNTTSNTFALGHSRSVNATTTSNSYALGHSRSVNATTTSNSYALGHSRSVNATTTSNSYALGHSHSVNTPTIYSNNSKNENVTMEKDQRLLKSILLTDKVTPSPSYVDSHINELSLETNNTINGSKKDSIKKSNTYPKRKNYSKWFEKFIKSIQLKK